MKKKVFFLIIIFKCIYSYAWSQVDNQSNNITIYVITSCSPINWTTPANLFKSLNVCYLTATLKKNYYIIGHTIVRINSSRLSKPMYIAMSGVSKTEKLELVYFKKLGLGALGATIRGHIETEESILKGTQLYSKRGNIALIKFLVPEKSIERILSFVDYYQKKTPYNIIPAEMYNGALYPRYENEGSGCSAFAISLLDIGQVLPTESSEWCVNIKLPMNLIGGEFNNNKKIKISALKNTQTWYEGTGIKDIDYVNHIMYDPSIIFNWIKNKRQSNDSIYKQYTEEGIPGLLIDNRKKYINPNEQILLQRKDSDTFIRKYHSKIKKQN